MMFPTQQFKILIAMMFLFAAISIITLTDKNLKLLHQHQAPLLSRNSIPKALQLHSGADLTMLLITAGPIPYFFQSPTEKNCRRAQLSQTVLSFTTMLLGNKKVALEVFDSLPYPPQRTTVYSQTLPLAKGISYSCTLAPKSSYRLSPNSSANVQKQIELHIATEGPSTRIQRKQDLPLCIPAAFCIPDWPRHRFPHNKLAHAAKTRAAYASPGIYQIANQCGVPLTCNESNLPYGTKAREMARHNDSWQLWFHFKN